MTVSDLCDLYVGEGCSTKKPRSLLADRAGIERHIKPLVGSKRARDLTRADVERLQRDVADGKIAATILAMGTRPGGVARHSNPRFEAQFHRGRCIGW
jgi:Phage integrase, N-terminal SAM-like domain